MLLGTPSRELVTRNEYDILGNVVKVTNPRGYFTSFGYTDNYSDSINRNSFAYVTQVTSPATAGGTIPHVTSRKYYFPTGPLYQAVGENSETATAAYDTISRVSSITFPDNGQTSFGYTDAGPPAPTVWEFDTAGQPEGWTAIQHLSTPFTVAQSTLQATTMGTAPQI